MLPPWVGGGLTWVCHLGLTWVRRADLVHPEQAAAAGPHKHASTGDTGFFHLALRCVPFSSVILGF